MQQPKTRRDAPHNCPNSLAFTGPFAAQKVIGAAVGVRAQYGLLFGAAKGSLATARLGHTLHHGGGGQKQKTSGSVTAAGLGKVQRACGARPLVGEGQEVALPASAACLLVLLWELAAPGGRPLRDVPLLGSRNPSSSRQRRNEKPTLADLLETVACRFPSTRLGSVVDDISTQTPVTAKMVTVVTYFITRSVTQGPK